MLRRFCLCLSLTALGACSPSKPAPTPAPILNPAPIPAGLLVPCPGKYAGPLNTVGDLVTRGNVAEASLAQCAGQVEKLAEWNAETGLPK